MDKPTYENLVETLEDMALQYLSSDIGGHVMTHDFMCAGENCLDVLERLGMVETKDGVNFVSVNQTHNKPVQPVATGGNF